MSKKSRQKKATKKERKWKWIGTIFKLSFYFVKVLKNPAQYDTI